MKYDVRVKFSSTVTLELYILKRYSKLAPTFRWIQDRVEQSASYSKSKTTSTSGLTNKTVCFPESHSYVKDAVYVYRRGCSVHSVCRVQCARRCTALCTKLRLATVIYEYTKHFWLFLLPSCDLSCNF